MIFKNFFEMPRFTQMKENIHMATICIFLPLVYQEVKPFIRETKHIAICINLNLYNLYNDLPYN